jgi:hypothetical protein
MGRNEGFAEDEQALLAVLSLMSKLSSLSFHCFESNTLEPLETATYSNSSPEDNASSHITCAPNRTAPSPPYPSRAVRLHVRAFRSGSPGDVTVAGAAPVHASSSRARSRWGHARRRRRTGRCDSRRDSRSSPGWPPQQTPSSPDEPAQPMPTQHSQGAPRPRTPASHIRRARRSSVTMAGRTGSRQSKQWWSRGSAPLPQAAGHEPGDSDIDSDITHTFQTATRPPGSIQQASRPRTD